MIGTITNTISIIIGSVAGAVMKRGIKPEYQSVMFTAMGLASLSLGFNAVARTMPKSEYPVLFIVSIALGGLLGTILDIDGHFKQLVNHFDKSGKDGSLAKGLSTGILLYCIGTFSIVGPMLSALEGDNTFLYTNATLDLITSAVLAATYGIGMVAAAPVLFCWQGTFYLIAKLFGPVIPDTLVSEIITVGGTLIVASGLSLLDIKDCKSLNLLPSLLIPVLFFLVKGFFGM
ncbi:MAG: DUF554 domain-containing protein [Bacteroidaceae bacterium]|nr:DUF554 domain-containing protein [Bacteroidaceae bacterium]